MGFQRHQIQVYDDFWANVYKMMLNNIIIWWNSATVKIMGSFNEEREQADTEI